MVHSLFTILCLSCLGTLSPISYPLSPIPYLLSGWLLWDSVEFIPAHKNEQTVKDWNPVISKIPQTAIGKKNKTIHITIMLISRQPDIHRFLNEIGWTEISPDAIKSISDALKEISSGRQPVKFPPANKWLIEDKRQDISFAKYFEDRRVEFYLWRSPFKIQKTDDRRQTRDSGLPTTDSPLWYGAIGGSFYKTESEQTELLKLFQNDVKKFANVHKKIKIHSVPASRPGEKITKKNFLVIEIPIDY